MKTAKIIIGLGFGDEGKGITTDFLCKENPNAIVIRFSGGQQAAHTVILNGKKHVHSSFASGALRGLPSYFSEHCTIHPSLLFNEKKELDEKGGNTNIYIHPLAKITTPFDVWANRNNTKNLEDGTCGKGVGATMKRNETPYKLFALDLIAPKPVLLEKLKSIATYYGFHNDEKLQNEVALFLKAIETINWNVVDYSFLNQYETLLFEGSQGILLDMDYGFFPNVTYANTTSKNAIEICEKLKITTIENYYITRSYSTRHGSGWMPNEEVLKLQNNEEETCTFNEFQKELRVGKLNIELLVYAFQIDQAYTKATKNYLVITCLDQYKDEADFNKIKKYFNKIYGSFSPESKFIKELKL